MEGNGSMENQVSEPEQRPSEWDQAVRLFASRGLLLCLTLFLIEIGIFFAVTSAPYFPGEQALYSGEAHQLGNQVSNSTNSQLLVQIFTNNYRIALIEMIPVIGVVLFAVSIYATARVTKAIAGIDGVPAVLVVLLLLVIFPHSLLELSAYAVATAEGLYFLYAIIKWLGGNRARLNREWGQLAINLVLVTIILAVDAVFETVEIALGDYFCIMWVPFIGVVVGVVRLNRRLSKVRKGEAGKTVASPTRPVVTEQGPP